MKSAADIKDEIASETRVSIGVVVAPTDAEQLLDARVGWTLRIAISLRALETFRRFATSSVLISEGLQLPALSFLVVVYQASTVQHRVLLPLVGPTVRRVVGDLRRHGLSLWFEAPDGEGLVAHIEVIRNQAETLAAAHVQLDEPLGVQESVRDAASILRRGDGFRRPSRAAEPTEIGHPAARTCFGYAIVKLRAFWPRRALEGRAEVRIGGGVPSPPCSRGPRGRSCGCAGSRP